MKQKLALFCDVEEKAVIENLTADTIYEVPLMMQEEGLDRIVLEKLGMDYSPVNMEDWAQMVNKIKNPQKKVKVAVVGKYVELPDAYISVTDALPHAGNANDAAVKIHWVNSEEIENSALDLDEEFAGCKGILVPGGLVIAVLRARLRLFSMPESTRFHSWACALVCSVQLLNLPATYAA